MLAPALAPTVVDRAKPIVYPESDGKPMSDNTKQFRWIVTLAGNLQALFHDRSDVFVSGNQFWYTVERESEEKASPDVYVVFGRPKGDRSSYKQWEENDIPMTVVFEVRSPRNDHWELIDKQVFYEEHGVEEYYLYDPDYNRLEGFLRQGTLFRRERSINGFVSPRLGIRFDLSGPELVVRYPDGRPFLGFAELEAIRLQVEQRAGQAELRADQAEQRAGQAEQRADQAEQRALQESQRAAEVQRRNARLAELTRKLLRQEATPEELQELQQLSQEP